jgi:hypothetical protein
VDANGPVRGSAVEATYGIEVVTAVIAAVHDRGARVAVHTNTEVVGPLIRAGIDSVEHGAGLTAEDLELLGARGGAWTLTLGASVVGAPSEPDVGPASGSLGAPGLAAAAGDPVRRADPRRLRRGGHGRPRGRSPGSARAVPTEGLAAATAAAQDYLGVSVAEDLVTYDEDPRVRVWQS